MSVTENLSCVPSFALVAESAGFQRVLTAAERFATSGTAPILLEGESGTGKTSLARYIHQLSPRAGKPFNSIIVGTLDDSLASSELFGHVAGAFTDARRARKGGFVASQGSTLFLDELGKASRAVQAKLLHAIEYNEITPVGADTAVRVDVRIVAATNVTLATLVERNEFLPDLAARFGYFRIRVPALSERRADIPGLLEQCVARRAHELGYGSPPSIHSELLRMLQGASWPTNLRGLDSAVQYMLAVSAGAPELTLEHCIGALDDDIAAFENRERAKRETVTALVSGAGSISAAARDIGVARSTIQRRLMKARKATDGETTATTPAPEECRQ